MNLPGTNMSPAIPFFFFFFWMCVTSASLQSLQDSDYGSPLISMA